MAFSRPGLTAVVLIHLIGGRHIVYLVRSATNPKERIGLFGPSEISDGKPNCLHWMAFGGFGGIGIIPHRSLDS